MFSIGAVERRNPLPPGRYWIDVFGADIEPFDMWLKGNGAIGFVDVLSTEFFDGQPAVPPFLDARPARNWILFRVNAHTPFNQIEFGFPTIAGNDINTSSDTAQRPDPEEGPNLARILLLSGVTILGFLAISTYLSTRPIRRAARQLVR